MTFANRLPMFATYTIPIPIRYDDNSGVMGGLVMYRYVQTD